MWHSCSLGQTSCTRILFRSYILVFVNYDICTTYKINDAEFVLTQYGAMFCLCVQSRSTMSSSSWLSLMMGV